MYLEITLIAYLIDKIFGEFSFIKHPVVLMGDYIKWFENRFYKNNIINGIFLAISLIILVWLVVFVITFFLDNIFILGMIASTGIASHSLHKSVKEIIEHPHKIKYLVSRDTKDLSPSDINKAAIETYSENLSDGVIAPLFYLSFFGLSGLFIYKAINTLDSMVGYRNEKYEKFGKFSAKLDDIANLIPAKITAVLISTLMFSNRGFANIFKYGNLHDSPNAGYPISAMAGVCDVSLGGATSYFGKIKQKPCFGCGKNTITKDDIQKALSFQIRLDIAIVIIISMCAML